MILFLFVFLFFSSSHKLKCLPTIYEQDFELPPPTKNSGSVLLKALDEEKKRAEALENMVQEQQHKLILKTLEIDSSKKVNQNLLENLYLSEEKNDNLAKQLSLLEELVKNLQNSYFRDVANNYAEQEEEKDELKKIFSEILENKDLFSFKKLCKKLLEDKLLITEFKADISKKIMELKNQNKVLLNLNENNKETLNNLKEENTGLINQLKNNQMLNNSELKDNNLKLSLLESLSHQLNQNNQKLTEKDSVISDLKNDKKKNLLELENIHEQLKLIESKILLNKSETSKKEAMIISNLDSNQKQIDSELEILKSKLQEKEKDLEEKEWSYRRKLLQSETAVREYQKKDLDLKTDLKLAQNELLLLKNSLKLLHEDFYETQSEQVQLKSDIAKARDLALHLDHSHRDTTDALERKRSKLRSMKKRVNNQAPQIKHLEELVIEKNKILSEFCLQKEALVQELSLTYNLLDIFKINQGKQDLVKLEQDNLLKLATNEVLIQNKKLDFIKKDIFLKLKSAGIFEEDGINKNSVFASSSLNKLLEENIFNKKISDLTSSNCKIDNKKIISFLCGSDFNQIINNLLPSKNSLSSICKSKTFAENSTTEDKLELNHLRSKEIIDLEKAYKLLLARKNILTNDSKLDLNLSLAWADFKESAANYFQDEQIKNLKLAKQDSDHLILNKLAGEISLMTI